MSDVLLLNADAQPVSYLPLSAITWKEAITRIFLEKAIVLEWYDDWIVRSVGWETKVPAVIMLKEMMRRKGQPKFTRSNVYLRDLYTCQYCNTQAIYSWLTLDHVIPSSRGGKTEWSNIVTACHKCNVKKGNNLYPKPNKEPHKPTYHELVNKRKQLKFNIKHPSWNNFI